ncbi:glycosyltransferase [Fluviispira sanaruensis]|uniref:Glycosyltransferase 2-like domain-containing protein n=1 Tax=Fluviispira sanaruensis TaxID=2493639 RepID=A0A4V0P2Q6_FLUSA|nr:glycosyltransferase [Fluviispira sanaruensis]BBH54057.1 hypothetical protein JCM31447_25140 [Fluviispira sanaruensis]
MRDANNFDNQLTCIINVRNGEKYIEETINSVLMQTVKVQIIVIDNHSTDNTENIVKKYNNITYWKTPFPCSLGEARNFSIEKINSEYVAWLDADDLWESDFALTSLNAFTQNEFIAFTSSLALLINENSELYPDNEQPWKENNALELYTEGIDLEKCYKINGFLGPWSGHVFSTKCIKKTCGFNKYLKYAEDFDFILRFFSFGKNIHINKRICRYRVHPRQETQQISDKNKMNEILYVVEKNKNINNLAISNEMIRKTRLNYHYKVFMNNKSILNFLNLLIIILSEKQNIFIFFKKIYKSLKCRYSSRVY